MEAGIVVIREAATWTRTTLYSGEVEDRGEPRHMETYFIERGREKFVYRPHRQRRRIPRWAADALRAAYGIGVPDRLVKD